MELKVSKEVEIRSNHNGKCCEKATNNRISELESLNTKLRESLLNVRYACQMSNGKSTASRLYDVYRIADKAFEEKCIEDA